MPYLKLLGGAIVTHGAAGTSGVSSRRHPLALLALLATAPARTLSRGKLVGYLWPEAREKTARNRLTSCVYQVRSEFGDDIVLTTGDDLCLNGESLRSDVCQFEQAIGARDFTRAAGLYGGPFMDGFWLRGSAEFERWIDRERDRLHREYLDALEALAREAGGGGDIVAAAAWWRERWNEDPFDSRVACRLMEALAAAGNRSEALRVASTHSRMLDEEIGVEPDAELRTLVKELQAPPCSPPTLATAAGSGNQGMSEAGDGLPVRSIAVLPFDNLSGTADGELFAAGLHDDLLTELSRISALKVIARTSVLRYRDTRETIPEIARDLGAGTVMEGSVQTAGGRLRLNLQLIDGRSGVHQWAERYDRQLSMESIFDIQSELAEKVAGVLRGELTPMEKERAAREPTQHLEAYRLYAEGRRWLDQRTERGMRRALEYFDRATQIDPRYALAWVGLADTLSLLHDYGYEDEDAVFSRAEAAVHRALELDSELAEAHAAQGAVHGIRGDRDAGARHLRRAVQLRPSYAEAHNWLSWHYLVTGDGTAALASAKRAVELDPLSPEAVSNLSLSHLGNGNAETALAEARRAWEIQPDWTTSAFYEALALYHLGRYREAMPLLTDLPVAWAGSGPKLTLALAHLRADEPARGRQLLAEFRDLDDHYAMGVVHLALGERLEAFQAFERVDRFTYWPVLSLHHLYPDVLAPLRADPLYHRLIAKLEASAR